MDLTVRNFPGYEFKQLEDGSYHNMYRGTDLGFGGYVYGEPGIHTNVALLDVASQHPHSIIAMNCFGDHTARFKELLDARIAIKHGDYETAKELFGGKLAPYLSDKDSASALAQALKIAINACYGLTKASFENPFRDIRNKNNIVALRGALFMRTLQDEIQNRGFTVAGIRTDSIKIPNATPEIISFAMDFANEYGYTFEHEATYDRMCLVNDAVYIAKYADSSECERQYGYIPEKNAKKSGKWTATGTQFAVPYVFKTLFSHEEIGFDDLCETKSVQKGALYLDMNESLPDVSEAEKKLDSLDHACLDDILPLQEQIAKGHDYHFIGRVGQFCPIKPGCGGGLLMREKDGKYSAAAGTKGYRWMESEMVRILEREADIDISYYDRLADAAKEAVSKYGDFDAFTSDEPYYDDSDLPF